MREVYILTIDYFDNTKFKEGTFMRTHHNMNLATRDLSNFYQKNHNILQVNISKETRLV